MVSFVAPVCLICGTFKTRTSRLVFACPVCGLKMVEVVDPEGEPESLFHCPEHCTTLIPTLDMIEDAKTRTASA